MPYSLPPCLRKKAATHRIYILARRRAEFCCCRLSHLICAPCASSSSAKSKCPLKVASCKGLPPPSPLQFTFALRLISSRASPLYRIAPLRGCAIRHILWSPFFVTCTTANVTKVTTTIQSIWTKLQKDMSSSILTRFKILNSGSIAFLIVVCAAYASAITALLYGRRSLATWEILVLGAAGIAYLITGTYGFTRCQKSGSLLSAVIYFVVQLSLATTMILLRGSAGELSMILLPLAGQSALLLPLRAMIPICALIYVTLVMPLLLRSRWVRPRLRHGHRVCRSLHAHGGQRT